MTVDVTKDLQLILLLLLWLFLSCSIVRCCIVLCFVVFLCSGEYDVDDVIVWVMDKIDHFFYLNVSEVDRYFEDLTERPIRMALFIENVSSIPEVYSQLFPQWRKDICM
jgi:hypothetical protein